MAPCQWGGLPLLFSIQDRQNDYVLVKSGPFSVQQSPVVLTWEWWASARSSQTRFIPRPEITPRSEVTPLGRDVWVYLWAWLLYKASKFRTVGFTCLLSMIWVPSRVEGSGIFSRLKQVQDLKCWEDTKKRICPLWIFIFKRSGCYSSLHTPVQ